MKQSGPGDGFPCTDGDPAAISRVLAELIASNGHPAVGKIRRWEILTEDRDFLKVGDIFVTTYSKLAHVSAPWGPPAEPMPVVTEVRPLESHLKPSNDQLSSSADDEFIALLAEVMSAGGAWLWVGQYPDASCAEVDACADRLRKAMGSLLANHARTAKSEECGCSCHRFPGIVHIAECCCPQGLVTDLPTPAWTRCKHCNMLIATTPDRRVRTGWLHVNGTSVCQGEGTPTRAEP